MPELPEVETMVRGVRDHLIDRRILATRFCRCSRKPIQISPARPRLKQALKDGHIREVERLAKRIVITVEPKVSGDDVRFIVIEPRMTGLLLITDPPTQEHRRIQWDLAPHPELAASFEFWDRRGLGTVRVLSELQLDEVRHRLGPDPLQLAAEVWMQQLRRTQRPVKNALLDQQIVVGIGNIYASEILHMARINPETPAASLSAARVQRIATASTQILNDAIRYEGSTLGDGTYRNVLNQDGSYQNKHCVYQKADELCPTCRRSRIRRIVQAQRSTFYCPRCQSR